MLFFLLVSIVNIQHLLLIQIKRKRKKTMIIKQEEGQAPVIKTEIDLNVIDFLHSDLVNIRETLKRTIVQRDGLLILQDIKLKYHKDHELFNSNGLVETTLKVAVDDALDTLAELKNRLDDEADIHSHLSASEGFKDTKALVEWFRNRKANQVEEGNENDTKH
jgi:hypothetical protein